MRRFTLLFIVSFLVICIANPVPLNSPRFAIRSAPEKALLGAPNGWEPVRKASPEDTITLSFFVKQSNLASLERELVEISDPTHPRFGRTLTAHQLDQLVAPSRDAVTTIMNWLVSQDIPTSSIQSTPTGDIIRVTTTIGVASKLLQAEYYVYRAEETAITITRTLSYTVPEPVAEHLDFLGPTIRFPNANRIKKSASLKRLYNGNKNIKHQAKTNPTNTPSKPVTVTSQATPSTPSSSSSSSPVIISSPRKQSLKSLRAKLGMPTMTVEMLQEIYETEGYMATSTSNVTAVIASFLEEYINLNDLDQFLDTYSPQAKTKVTIRGPNDDSEPGSEASLDIQYLVAMSPGLPHHEFWYTPGRQEGSPENEPFLEFLFNLAQSANSTTPPSVVSISYGDDEETVLESYANRVNVEFQKAGARGVSIIVASGDGGVSGGHSKVCAKFVPTFPAASPWVTAVGGTTSFEPEIAASISTGGFSNRWPRPKWQKAAIDKYFNTTEKSLLPPTHYYSPTGAGFPDVSAQSLRFPIIQEGRERVTDGTSASAPVFAGIVALLNDARARIGKKPLGFLNQLIYTNPDVFNDVIEGNNPGCDTDGFYASEGWDPVTGMGTPNFPKLKALAEKLP